MQAGAERFLQVRETHCAGVVLAGDRAFKFKKPVTLPFLDFATATARWEACRHELELNRRFSPDVYLGLATLTLPDGRVEPVVVMRRMPEGRRLATLVRSGADVTEALRATARRLAVAHAAAHRSPEIDAHVGLDALQARWTANIAEAREFAPPVIDPGTVDDVEHLVGRFLAGRRPLFERRIAQGAAVDGHGDLMAEDIFCLDDGPRVLDCLEFDDALRHVDRLDDAAFLSMDLERLGAPELAAAFLHAYAEFSGDPSPPSLQHHYTAYRAFVRAKIACLRSDRAAGAVAEARLLLGVAHRHLQAGRVTLTLVGGLPGTGKTTLARALGDRLGAVVLSSDRLRKELAGMDPGQGAAAAYREGIYSAEHSRRTYAELLREAGALLGLGESVVLDASWSARPHREQARRLARETSSELVEVSCAAPAELVEQRLGLRRAQRQAQEQARGRLAVDYSDADVAVATTMAQDFAAWPEALTLDTAPAPEVLADRVGALVQPVSSAYAAPRRRSRMGPD